MRRYVELLRVRAFRHLSYVFTNKINTVVVENEQYKHIMRKYYRGSSVVVLSPVSFNEAYEDTVISGDETLNLVGVVVWWQSSDMME